MLRFPISRFIVKEDSMLPVYKPGDHVLTFNWGKVVVGDVVVYRSNSSLRGVKRRSNLRLRLLHFVRNDDRETYYIKRVYKCIDNNVYIKGDNKAKSAKMMPIRSEQIVGKVWFRY